MMNTQPTCLAPAQDVATDRQVLQPLLLLLLLPLLGVPAFFAAQMHNCVCSYC
jgi:hypothetical protein